MKKKDISPKQVGKDFSDKWWKNEESVPSIYDDLMGKLQSPDYMVKSKPVVSSNRTILACKFVIDSCPKGGRVLDMACGVGSAACCLTSYGYEVKAFDISEKAIERARSLAQRLGQDPAMFNLADVSCTTKMADESFDAILAIGLFRYLDRKTQDLCYRNIHRILKPRGKFAVVHQNLFFEAFALNDDSLKFWANMIEGYSDASRLFGDKSVLEALNEMVKVPKREYKSYSISRNMETQAENPITYHKIAADYGFRQEKIYYPCTHVLPPYLEARVNQEALDELKKKAYMNRIEDWRAMFIEYEFLALLEKK